tara:strand:- start:3397 stop:3624 length:228 start_codon:yes stop_codon:yes gene_type:complete
MSEDYTSYEKRMLCLYSEHSTETVLEMLQHKRNELSQSSKNLNDTKLSKFKDDIAVYSRSVEVMRFVLAERGTET